MPGSFSYDPGSGDLAGFALPTGVFLYDPESESDDGPYTILPNIQCLEIQKKDGADPSSARFAYILDDRSTVSNFPNQFEQLWPLNVPQPNEVGQYIVQSGDRIVVLAILPDGSFIPLFDGFPRLPEVHVSGSSQDVPFTAIGAMIRCYDVPIGGRVQRDGDDPTAGTVVDTDLPTRFNPRHGHEPTDQPNCTPDDGDVDETDTSISYPIFIDPSIDRTPDPRTFWTLNKVCRYLLSIWNPQSDPNDENFKPFVTNPNFDDITDILDNRKPKQKTGVFDPSDPSTYTSDPIIVRDFDCTNMAWPEAIERLLGYHGFGMRWVLEQDDEGEPTNTFKIYRKDAADPSAAKPLFFPVKGTPIDPSTVNVAGLSANFDYHGVANQFVIETHPNRYEVSVVLAPGFTPTAGDQLAANRKSFLKANLDGAVIGTRQKYRYYIADECADGHWNGTAFVTNEPFDFSAIFPPSTAVGGQPSKETYVRRYRPGSKKLLTEDGNGDVYEAELALSRDFTGNWPDFWDGTGHWQPIEPGSWELLEDRLGINFTVEDPEAIKVGTYTGANKQEKSKVLKGVTSIANPSGSGSSSFFYLRLTTVIDSDQMLVALAPRRVACSLANIVERRIDAKDKFRRDTVAKNSAFLSEAENNFEPDEGVGADDVVQIVEDAQGGYVVRDDSEAAEDHACQLRTAHEQPAVAGSFTIPYISFAYEVGDRISEIAGRDCSLQGNAADEQGEGASYPFIVALAWSFAEGRQATIGQLSDRRLEDAPINHRGRGR